MTYNIIQLAYKIFQSFRLQKYEVHIAKEVLRYIGIVKLFGIKVFTDSEHLDMKKKKSKQFGFSIKCPG